VQQVGRLHGGNPQRRQLLPPVPVAAPGKDIQRSGNGWHGFLLVGWFFFENRIAFLQRSGNIEEQQGWIPRIFLAPAMVAFAWIIESGEKHVKPERKKPLKMRSEALFRKTK
jgi:hypothetical protein